jgi:exodeoxyribonuclease VII large subunit
MSPTTQNPQNPPVLTVTQLTNAIKNCLENTFPFVWLKGELSNCKLHSSGHFYFSLKDANAQIAAVMYRTDVAQLPNIPKDGDQVVVKGEINVYPPKGNYQILVRELKPVGLGELLQKLQELKIKLNKKGYFKQDRKRPLPKMPRRIGVVTSPTGAAIQDILNILTRRFYGFHLILNPVKVQGEGAAQEIAQAIRQLNEYDLVDVMIVGRGGGSLEDLWAFNEEIVADAIYHSRIPVISAVGHEVDHCIADYVADVRAPTPSAAAELVIAEKAQQLHHLSQVQQRLQQTLQHLIKHDRHRLEGLKRHPIFHSPYGLLGPWMQKLDDLRDDLDQSMKQILTMYHSRLDGRQRVLLSLKPMTQIQHFKQKLLHFDKAISYSFLNQTSILKKRLGQMDIHFRQIWSRQMQNKQRLFNREQRLKLLDQLMLRQLHHQKDRLKKLSAALHSINPKNLLSKGYAILFAEKDHSVITSVRAVEKNSDIRLLLCDGEILSTVKEIIEK